MHGHSGHNINFPDTLAKMSISPSDLQPSVTGFHGFVPGYPIWPLGWIGLEVIFGDEENFKSEKIQFEVAPFHNGYNAILGRSAYAQFMAVPSYAYLQLKMPGPSGMITSHGIPESVLQVEVVNVELTEAALASVELEQIKRSVDTSTMTLTAKPRLGPVFQPEKDMKNFQVQPKDERRQ